MSDKTIKESYMDELNPNCSKENNTLKADEETITGALNDELVVSYDSTSTYIETAISRILTNSVYGMTTFTDKAMPSISIASTTPEADSVLTEIKTKAEHLLSEVELLKSRVDELEQENKLLRSRADKADTENEELRRRDGVLERHISELMLKFML